jgi:outer membrane immunogenic protein
MKKILLLSAVFATLASANTYAGKMNESGFNIGMNAGWLHGKSTQELTNWEDDSEYTGQKERSSDYTGLGGIQLGYRYVKNDVMIGFEGDYQISNVKNNNLGAPYYDETDAEYATANVGQEINRIATLRMKFGYVATPDTLLYLTGGYAYTKGNVELYDGNGNTGHSAARDNVDANGWTAGFGVEQSLTELISVKAEYLYLRTRANASSFNSSEDESYHSKNIFQANLVRLGLNFNF